MEKEKTYKCPVCGQPVLANEAVPLKRRYLHKYCFDSQMKLLVNDRKKKDKAAKKKTSTSKAKPEAELKEGLSEEEYAEKKKYYEKLRSLQKEIEAKDYKLSEDYMKKYSLSWNDLYNTLCYIFDLMGMSPNGSCVGLIPYYCDAAKRFYRSLEHLENYGRTLSIEEIQGLYKKRKIMYTPCRRPVPLIDISKIGEDEC